MYDFETMDQRKIVFGTIFLLANRLQTVMDQAANGLTAKQWFVITMLGMFDDPPTLKQLASICDSSHQNTKQIVLKLEEKGFVRVEQDAKDRRALRIVSTDLWRRWDNENRENATKFLNQMFSSLNEDELSSLNSAQQKLYETLGTMKEELI